MLPWHSAGPAPEPAVEQPPKPNSSLPVNVRIGSECLTEKMEANDVSKQADLHTCKLENKVAFEVIL